MNTTIQSSIKKVICPECGAPHSIPADTDESVRSNVICTECIRSLSNAQDAAFFQDQFPSLGNFKEVNSITGACFD